MKGHFIGITLSVIIAIAISGSMMLNKSNTKKETVKTVVYTKSIDLESSKALFEAKCNFCHAVKENPKDMIAPPFSHIKSKYKAVYKTKDEFINALVKFTQNPNQESALMRGALNKFAVMPKLSYSEKELNKIATFIYNNEFPRPFPK
jgi:cytochrome c551/c552